MALLAKSTSSHFIRGRYHLGTGIMTIRSFACSVMRQTDPGKDILVRLSKSPDFERHYSSGA